MPAPDFLDTSVLVYAYDVSDPEKQRVAPRAAAERAGCERIWSEDLNASQKYFGSVSR